MKKKWRVIFSKLIHFEQKYPLPLKYMGYFSKKKTQRVFSSNLKLIFKNKNRTSLQTLAFPHSSRKNYHFPLTCYFSKKKKKGKKNTKGIFVKIRSKLIFKNRNRTDPSLPIFFSKNYQFRTKIPFSTHGLLFQKKKKARRVFSSK